MKTCEEFEMLASAFVDDELSRDETVTLLDHLATCESCRFFYRQSRALGAALSGSPAAVALPMTAWQRIESRVRPRMVIPAWGVRAAAGILLGLLVWQLGQFRFPPLRETGSIEVALEESKGVMSDDRFVELTSELLRADRRYHVAMLQVMTDVNQATGMVTVSEESMSSEGDNGEMGGEWNERKVAS